jgi:predicted phosphatase
MFIIDFDDTLFDTHALKKILVQSRQPEEKELKELLFSDAFSFLRYLKIVKQKLILLSFGEFSFQNKKINATGITHLFDEIIITTDCKELALEKILKEFNCEKDIWFINDKIEETKKILERFPKLKPILKKSPRFTDEEYGSAFIPCFSTLTQIQQYVEQRIK